MKRNLKKAMLAVSVVLAVSALPTPGNTVWAKNKAQPEHSCATKPTQERLEAVSAGKVSKSGIEIKCTADPNTGTVNFEYEKSGTKHMRQKDISILLSGHKVLALDCRERQTIIITDNTVIYTDGYGDIYFESSFYDLSIPFNLQNDKIVSGEIKEKFAAFKTANNKIGVVPIKNGWYTINNEMNGGPKFHEVGDFLAITDGENRIWYVVWYNGNYVAALEGNAALPPLESDEAIKECSLMLKEMFERMEKK